MKSFLSGFSVFFPSVAVFVKTVKSGLGLSFSEQVRDYEHGGNRLCPGPGIPFVVWIGYNFFNSSMRCITTLV